MRLILTIGADRVGKLTDEDGSEVGTCTGLSTEGTFESLRAVLEIKLNGANSAKKKAEG